MKMVFRRSDKVCITIGFELKKTINQNIIKKFFIWISKTTQRDQLPILLLDVGGCDSSRN